MLEQVRVEAVAEPDAGLSDAGLGEAAEVVVIPVRPASGADESVRIADVDVARLGAWGVDLPRRLARAKATGARSETTWIDLEQDEPRAVLAVGLGAGTPADLRRSAAAAMRRLRGVGEVLVLATRDLDEAGVRAFAEGLILATGAVSWASTPPPAPPERVRVAVADLDPGSAAVAIGTAHARASVAARRLIHTPSNLKSPAWMADQAVELGDGTSLDVRVWQPDELARDGFGGILAVGSGSVRSPRLVQLSWDPSRAAAIEAADVPPGSATDDDARSPRISAAGARLTSAGHVSAGPARHVVLVGKGVTFDSGGLSLKPPEMQVPMKTDMSGAAVVWAVMGGLSGERVPPGVRVTGLLCLAENLPGAAAARPGDVVTHHGGVTSEVLNTDAEGRLVLGDGLDYAVRDLAADAVIDVATLTGAATLGLGRGHAALFSNVDGLAAALAEAGDAAGERVWRMPLLADYAELISSDVADHANSNRGEGASPGAITAALFLQRFVGDTPWAHLDIAGVGRSDAERDDLPKGGTGFGARLLLRWIEAGAPL